MPRLRPLLFAALLFAPAAGAQTHVPSPAPRVPVSPALRGALAPAASAEVARRTRLLGDLRARIAQQEQQARAAGQREADRRAEQRRLALGYTHRHGRGRDCDDTRADVHPNATEVCDYVDNNCDGVVDENQRLAFFLDADGDGHGDPAQRVDACPYEQSRAAADGRWLVLVGNDCDDTDAGRWQRCD